MELKDWLTSGLALLAIGISLLALLYARRSAKASERSAAASETSALTAAEQYAFERAERDDSEGPTFVVTTNRKGLMASVDFQLTEGPDLRSVRAVVTLEEGVKFTMPAPEADHDTLDFENLVRGAARRLTIQLAPGTPRKAKCWVKLNCREQGGRERSWVREEQVNLVDRSAKVHRAQGTIPRTTESRRY